jgi:hypothetical protein
MQIHFAPQAPQSIWPYFMREGNCTNAYQGLAINWTNPAGVAGSQATPPPVCSNGKLPPALMQTDYRNFAPRAGISWSPDSKLVIRAGYGIFYNQDIANAYFDMARNIAGRVTQTSGQNGGTVGVPNLFWSSAAPGGSGAVAQIPPPYAYVMAPNHRTSYTMQYLVNVQRQVGGDWIFEGGYVGNESHHLYGFQDPNQAIPYGYLGNGAATPISSRLPFLNYGVIQLVQDGGNGIYNAFSFKVTRRFGTGMSLVSSYTWSKSIDTTSGIRPQGGDQLFPQNSECTACERALSAFDVRHRVVTSVLYSLPVGRGRLINVNNRFLNGAIGGWQMGGILTLQTGVPGNLSIGGIDNASTSEGGYDRPSVVPGVSPYASNPTASRYLNPAAFFEAPPGTFGDAARNLIEGPGIINLDAEIHKEFHMPYRERHLLQFRLEAFNAPNHPNWGMPALNILAGQALGQPGTSRHQSFGIVSSTSTSMRQVQIGLKYIF